MKRSEAGGQASRLGENTEPSFFLPTPEIYFRGNQGSGENPREREAGSMGKGRRETGAVTRRLPVHKADRERERKLHRRSRHYITLNRHTHTSRVGRPSKASPGRPRQ